MGGAGRAWPRRFAASSRARSPTGAHGGRRCWNDLAGLGIFSIALPAEAGGGGGTVADLAAALEQITYALVPGPVLPTLLAGLVLASHTDLPAVKALLPALADGHAPVAVGLTTATMTGARPGDGTLRVNGEIGPVLGGGSTAQLLLGAVTGRGRGVVPARGRPAGCHGDWPVPPPTSPGRWPASGSPA